VRVIARRPDAIVGFGDTRIHAETATFELRVSEVANPRPDDQVTVDGEIFVVQGEPERRDPDRLVWNVDATPTKGIARENLPLEGKFGRSSTAKKATTKK
jgi:hypothetical protein